MTDYAYEHGFGLEWSDCLVQYRQGYGTSVSDFHKTIFSKRCNYIRRNPLKLDASGDFPLVLFKPHLSTYQRTTSGSV